MTAATAGTVQALAAATQSGAHGACLFTLVSLRMFDIRDAHVVAQIVAGVGFLGAGSIMRTEGYVHGLTTAASVWMVAAVGVAVGVHAYWLACIGTVLALIVLEFFRWVERFLSPDETDA